MMIENNSIPGIRNKGFADTWEQRKLGEDLKNVQTGTNKLGSTENTGMPLLKMGNIQRGYFLLDKVEYLQENDEAEPENVANNGDFFFNTRNTLELVGKGATWFGESGKYAFNSNIARFDLGEIDTVFFNYLYNTETMQNQVHARAMGTTSVAAIYPRTLDSITYYLPCKEEQLKIGEYLYTIDRLITLHQRKLEKLKNIKKSMLEKMFPREGAKIPEIRFQGFTDDWEQRKLRDLSSLITKGTTPLDKSGNGNINFIKIENIDACSGEIMPEMKISEEEHSGYLKRSQLQKDDILFSIAGTLGRVSIVKSSILPANTNQALAIIRVKEGDLGYLTTVLKGNAVAEFIRKNPTVGAQPNLSLEQVGNLEIPYPSRIEQEKIGAYFSTLDRLITLHQRRLEKIKNIKKSMLAKMFV